MSPTVTTALLSATTPDHRGCLALQTLPMMMTIMKLSSGPGQINVLFGRGPRGMTNFMVGSLRTHAAESKGRLFKGELNLIYDSKCNVRKLEMDFLRRRDIRLHGASSKLLRFTDLESGKYNETDVKNGGISYATGMKSMNAVTSIGESLLVSRYSISPMNRSD